LRLAGSCGYIPQPVGGQSRDKERPMQFSAKFAAVVAGFSVVVTSFVAWGEEPKACQCPEGCADPFQPALPLAVL
jgi:hypothetical protein